MRLPSWIEVGGKGEQIAADIKNIRGRRSYFGALDYDKREFLLQVYNKADSQSMRAFIEYLRLEKKEQRIAIFWDGANYRCCK